ncbi:MAG: phosphotransferase [Bacteroidia bacterium]|nr:phosphotransferase [Bacteroidia bacterium]
MDKRQNFLSAYPDGFFMDAADLPSLTFYLQKQGWISNEEKIESAQKPGEGNMNYVLRVNTGSRTFILKQSRPWVEKYPQIPAPTERTLVESKFFQTVEKYPETGSFTPKLRGYDASNFILALEDLGEGADFTYLYQKGKQLTDSEIQSLVSFISALHRRTNGSAWGDFPDNREMRLLNHEHIFRFPFKEENGFDLDTVQPGLQKISMIFKQNESLKQRITTLGDVYLSQGTTLLHGDYYPGSWLKVKDGVKIIDPEFGFVGYPEFDLGVFLAQMVMAVQGESVIRKILKDYDSGTLPDRELLAGFAGTEIMRRLIGLAQLPLALSLDEKKTMLEKAAEAILTGKIEKLF